MSSLRKIMCGTALGLLLAATIMPANAKTVFETATYTGNDTGEYILTENDLIGAAFTAHLATHHGDAKLSMQPAIARLSPCEARNSRS